MLYMTGPDAPLNAGARARVLGCCGFGLVAGIVAGGSAEQLAS
jgi:hypothetical protein